jgi:phenylalanyl-tRNA synthetase beta chain
MLVDLNNADAASDAIDLYPAAPEQRTIECRFSRIRQLMGVDIDDETISSILDSLYLRVTPSGEGVCQVSVPTFRDDLTIEADIIEEVARIHGLDKLETRTPEAASISEADESGYRAGEACRASLVSLGLSEIMNYSFVDAQLLDLVNASGADSRLVLPNPVSLDYAVMRDSLVPQMLKSLGHNLAHQTAEASLFEMGRIFFKRGDGTLGEEERLCIGLMGPVGRSGFDRRKSIKADEQFLWMKGILESLCADMQLEMPSLSAADTSWTEDGEAASLSWPGTEDAGVMGLVTRKIRHEWRMNMPIAVLEVRLSALIGNVFDVPAVQPIAVYPAVSRDMALVADESVRNGDVMSLIREIAPPELTDVELFDIYSDEGIGVGKRSLAYSFTYRSLTRTLTDEEANGLHESVKSQIAEKLNAEVRER